ncbi:MAG: MBL fold metallo-hydrolase [Alphaproteobacteria bacterium]|nr:MBL fold metallo-hydrolase [Alphaproteobacteria bacterium]
MPASLRIRLLGTGPSQGVPGLGGVDEAGDWGECDAHNPRNRRSRTAALIEAADGTRLLVDPGPDLRAQLLAARVVRLDAVLVTHAHADHVMGLDELRAVNRVTGRPLPVFALPETLEDLRRRFGYAFLPATPGFYRPALEPHAVEPGETLPIPALPARLLELDHHVMRTLGLRLGGFAYCTDLVRLPTASLEALRGIETWVVGCFGRRPHPVHAHLALVAEWATAIGARRTILTHMSNALDEAALRRELPPGLEPGFDGLEIASQPSA